MPESTMLDPGITTERLSTIRTMIQELNLKGQHSIGVIRVKLVMDDLSTSSIFYAIDAKTSYKPLLGQPWLHEIVTSLSINA